MSIQYCPTGDMVADFFTKPLQGTLFRKFRDLIMNDSPSSQGSEDCRSVLGKLGTQNEVEERTNEVSGSNEGWTLVQRKAKGTPKGTKTKLSEEVRCTQPC